MLAVRPISKLKHYPWRQFTNAYSTLKTRREKRVHLEDLSLDERIGMDMKEKGRGGVWTGLNCLGIGTIGGFLW